MTSNSHRLLLVHLIALAACGCSSFEREWKSFSDPPQPAGNVLIGRWQGTWTSDPSQHVGNLRCIITRAADAGYHAHYHATYWKIMTFEYSVVFATEQRGDHTHFSGEVDLGLLAGGRYQYEGHADRALFQATYRSKHDHGRFEMSRVPGGGGDP